MTARKWDVIMLNPVQTKQNNQKLDSSTWARVEPLTPQGLLYEKKTKETAKNKQLSTRKKRKRKQSEQTHVVNLARKIQNSPSTKERAAQGGAGTLKHEQHHYNVNSSAQVITLSFANNTLQKFCFLFA